MIPEQTVADLKSFVMEKAEGEQKLESITENAHWQGLEKTGSQLWLDTGDMEASEKLWNASISGLTTNNTLLNLEIQKGIYDSVVTDVEKILKEYPRETQVIETAFVLNALHGLRLVKRFGGNVSVELHTDVAEKTDLSVWYGERFYDICPEKFIIKIPMTTAGLLAAREISGKKIPVNFTLGFSARQNYIAALFAQTAYVNVFLGRLNSYIADNNLGDGVFVGEKTTSASQKAVAAANGISGMHTKQIAASLRSETQLRDLAGVDVFTMPVKVAQKIAEVINENTVASIAREFDVSLNPGTDPDSVRIDTLWDLSEKEKDLARSLCDTVPQSGEEISSRARDHGVEDLFPSFSTAEIQKISEEGKIPQHNSWKKRIAAKTLALDSLMNRAALESFKKDQGDLDARILSILAK